MEQEQPIYKCSQSALYATCRIIWTNYADELVSFAALRPLYTATYGTTAMAEILAAQLLPDDQARGSASEVAFIDLKDQYATEARLKWQILKSYIEFAYPNHKKPKLEEAGAKHYNEAGRNNWEELGQLMAKGSAFLALPAHQTQLSAGDNMPPAFVASFDAAKDGFDAQYLLFMNLATNQPAGTVSKISANNAIYQKVIRLSKDAPLAIVNQPERNRKLVFNHILSLVSNPPGNPAFEKIYTIAAGANLTLNELELTETMAIALTLLTDAGPSVTFCRNVIAGCAGEGKFLIYNQVVEAIAMELPGDDSQVVISNSTAIEVQVKVKVKTP